MIRCNSWDDNKGCYSVAIWRPPHPWRHDSHPTDTQHNDTQPCATRNIVTKPNTLITTLWIKQNQHNATYDSDTQHNNRQPNSIRHTNFKPNNTQHDDSHISTLSIMVDLGEKYFHSVNCRRDKCRYAKCRGTTTAALSSQYLFTLSVATGRF